MSFIFPNARLWISLQVINIQHTRVKVFQTNSTDFSKLVMSYTHTKDNSALCVLSFIWIDQTIGSSLLTYRYLFNTLHMHWVLYCYYNASSNIYQNYKFAKNLERICSTRLLNQNCILCAKFGYHGDTLSDRHNKCVLHTLGSISIPSFITICVKTGNSLTQFFLQ